MRSGQGYLQSLTTSSRSYGNQDGDLTLFLTRQICNHVGVVSFDENEIPHILYIRELSLIMTVTRWRGGGGGEKFRKF